MAMAYNAGIVTAYGAAVRGGYTGTYEEFCAQQANYAQNAAAVEQAKQDAQAAAQDATESAETLSESVAQIATNTQDISGLKEDKLYIGKLVLGISDFYAGNISADGSIVSGVNANYYSRLIKRSEYEHLHVGVAYGNSQVLNVAYYDNGSFVSRGSTWLVAGQALDIDNEYDVRILIAKNAPSSATISEQISNYTFDILRKDFIEFKDAITKTSIVTVSDFEGGGISTSGEFTAKTASDCRSRVFRKDEFKHITIHAKNGQNVLFAYALYNDNYEFVSRSNYFAGGRCVVIPNDYNVRITIADDSNNNSYSISEMIAKCEINIVKGKSKDSDSTKYMHLSFDDVEQCFRNLANNSYESLFDEPFFGFLQYLHITYGTKISLYLQNIAQLASVPNTYAEDFTQNAEWLKVGFHAYETGSLADTEEDAKTHYNTFASEISRICGTTSCIDRLPRLNYFSGNSEGVRGLINANSGIIGLLGADDNRYQYYLANSQLAYLRGHSLLYDDINHIAFVSTVMRLDWFIDGFSSQYEYNTPVEDNPYDELVYRYGQPNMGNLYNSLIIFTHEWQIYNGSALNANSNLVHDACKFAHDYGYSFDYPQTRVDDITSLTVYDNLFDYETTQSLNLFINTSNGKFGTPTPGQNYKLAVFRCRENTRYKITKIAGKTFRIATSADVPANDVAFISTVANHTGEELIVTTESNARYIGISYWSDSNGDIPDYATIGKSIKVVVN